MSTYTWSIPTGKTITGQTYIKDTDEKLSDTIDDLVDFVNGEGDHSGQGLTYDLVSKDGDQTIAGVKTFSETVNANISGDVVGNVTGALTGNASTADKLSTIRTIDITGEVEGTAVFDGTADVVINTTIPILVTGMIMMWSGSSASVPNGWYLCDGTNGTPNLVGRFVRGATASGATGGSANAVVVSHTHSASTNTTGSHTHYSVAKAVATSDMEIGDYTANYRPVNVGELVNENFEYELGETSVTPNTGTTTSSGNHSHSVTVNSSGASGTNKNLPPYYDICYIMKG